MIPFTPDQVLAIRALPDHAAFVDARSVAYRVEHVPPGTIGPFGLTRLYQFGVAHPTVVGWSGEVISPTYPAGPLFPIRRLVPVDMHRDANDDRMLLARLDTKTTSDPNDYLRTLEEQFTAALRTVTGDTDPDTLGMFALKAAHVIADTILSVPEVNEAGIAYLMTAAGHHILHGSPPEGDQP